MKTTRLYKHLRPITDAANIFEVTYGESITAVTHTDAEISSITIHRGTADPVGGIAGSTLEVTVRGRQEPLSGKDITLNCNAFVELSEHTNRSVPLTRYRGRTAKFAFTDRPGITASTTIGASSWTSILPQHSRQYSYPVGQWVNKILGDILNPPTNSALPQLLLTGSMRNFGQSTQPIESERASELISRFVEEPGTLVRDRHDGTIEALNLPNQKDLALAGFDVAYPITRAQVLAPSEREYELYENRQIHRIDTAADLLGATKSGTWVGSTEGWRTTTVTDLTHIYYREEEPWRMIGHALFARENSQYFQLPTVRIDLLMLLSSPRRPDREQAGQLLALNNGDPVYLSTDWDIGARGIHFAREITETISPSGWWLDLSLVPYAHVVGGTTPIPRPRVWDSQDAWWDEMNDQWDEV